MSSTAGRFSRRAWIVGAAIVAGGILVGVLLCGGLYASLQYTDSLEFCISCHEMKTTNFAEYSQTIHYKNASGVRAVCADCHVPKALVPMLVAKVFATNDLIQHFLGGIETPEKFEAQRLRMAKDVWAQLKADDSAECRSCHSYEAMDFHKQTAEAVAQMEPASKNGGTCIDCHLGIAHHLPKQPTRPASPRVAQAVPAPAASAPAAPPAAPAPATQTAAGESFIGLPIVPVTATAGGAPVAELYVSAPVTTASTDAADDAHITTTLWMKGDAAAAGPLYAAPNGIELGRLDSAASAKAGTPANGWVPVTIAGAIATNAVVKDLGPVWQNAETNYEFTCGGCHDLHDPHEHDPAQWATELVTMAKNANLEPPDAMLILKWLQTESLKPKTGN